MQNTSPIVLSESQLPTRKAQTSYYPRPEAKFYHVVFGAPSIDDVANDNCTCEYTCDCHHGQDEKFTCEPIDEQEIYGQLSVVNLEDIHLEPKPSVGGRPHVLNDIVWLTVDVTPTISHCSLVSIIGLAVRARLEQALPPNYRVRVRIKSGSHNEAEQYTKQLGDKERVCAALEKDNVRQAINRMLQTCS